jgi:pyridoxine 4-dehydrogenase
MPQIVGKEIGPIAFGMMGLTFPPQPLEQNLLAMQTALASGSNFWNAGTFYGAPTYNSLTLLTTFLTQHPDAASKIVLSVKAGFDLATLSGVGAPEKLKPEIDGVLAQLAGVGIGKIDVFECARVDPEVPIETTLKWLNEEYVQKGLVGGVALSEVSAGTIRKAAKVVKIVGVENEASLWETRFLTNGVAEACHELGIPLLA